MPQYKVVQCPKCQGYTYFRTDQRRNMCPRCRKTVDLSLQPGETLETAAEARALVTQRQFDLHVPAQLKRRDRVWHDPTQLILRMLRQQPGIWVTTTEVASHCEGYGVNPELVETALVQLHASGFIERQEELIRHRPTD
jgi:hypothetical protein